MKVNKSGKRNKACGIDGDGVPGRYVLRGHKNSPRNSEGVVFYPEERGSHY
jgi:hypothetical protein